MLELMRNEEKSNMNSELKNAGETSRSRINIAENQIYGKEPAFRGGGRKIT